MTLIAGFKFKNCPILFGDLLISGFVSEDKKIAYLYRRTK